MSKKRVKTPIPANKLMDAKKSELLAKARARVKAAAKADSPGKSRLMFELEDEFVEMLDHLQKAGMFSSRTAALRDLLKRNRNEVSHGVSPSATGAERDLLAEALASGGFGNRVTVSSPAPPSAPMNLTEVLQGVREAIDATFGDGYAADHPQVVIACLDAHRGASLPHSPQERF